MPLILYRSPNAEELNPRLEARNWEEIDKTPTLSATNRGNSWKFSKQFLEWDHEAEHELRRHLLNAVEAMVRFEELNLGRIGTT